MITRVKATLKRVWPSLHLRTILFVTLLLVASLPGFGALFLRVYENTVVRQTEAELISQGAALVAAAAGGWPGRRQPIGDREDYAPEASSIDLSSSPQLPERPGADAALVAPDSAALAAGLLLSPVLAETARTTLASLKLVDRNGIIVAGEGQGLQFRDVPELDAAFAGRAETVIRRNGAYQPRYALEWLSRAAAVRLHHVRPVIVDGKVVGALMLSRSPRSLFRGIYEDRAKIALGVALIFAALVVLAGLLSRGIVRPIDQLAAATRSVAAGRWDMPSPPVTAVIEIRDLFANFAAMADAIARRSRYLRDFATAVSHEFKTPLSSIRGSVELLQDHPDMTDAERGRFLTNIASDAGRLNHLVTRLIELARADMASNAAAERTDLSGFLRQAQDAWSSPTLLVELVGAEQPLWILCPASSLEAITSILIDNARQAGAAHVRFVIESEAGDMVGVRCEDNGQGIPPGDRERVFEPFFTSRRSSGGSGLGLPIARSLLEAAGGSIRLLDDTDSGTTFCIRFPSAGAT
ncbi:MAG: sensor histidine kinase [Sphingomonas sp.]|nr:MAG: sensor histidine kinase [Sphingomonas sp.]